MESVWGIRSSVDSAPYIYSASAGTVGPSNPSEAFSKRENQTSWLYNSPTTYGKGIEVSCSNCSDTVLYAENIDSLRSSHQNLKQPVSDVELRTSGRAGEYQGALLGLFQFHSEDEESQGRVYKQRHDGGGDQYYLYRVDQRWYVSDIFGERTGYLRADAGNWSQTTPPLKGWQYVDGGVWNDDPELECGKPSLPCRAVIIELSGEADGFCSKSPPHISILPFALVQLPGLSQITSKSPPEKSALLRLEPLVLRVLLPLSANVWDGTVGTMLIYLIGMLETSLCPVKLPTVASN